MPAPPSPGAFLVLTVTDGRLEPLLWAGERVLVEPAAGRAARRGEVVAAAAPAQGLGSFALGRAGEFETARLVGAVRGVWRGGRWLALAPEETRLGRAALALLSTLPAGVRGLAAAESWAYGLCRFRGLAAPAAAGARAAGRAAGGVRRLLAAASAAASRPAAPRPLPRGLPPTANPAGRLEQDETWGGLVRVEGDLVVPAGVTLTLKAGAVLRFPAGPARLSAERRPRGGGLAPVHEAGKAALLVYGRLVAEGAPDAPVRLGGGDEWGGLHVLGDGRARLDGVELSGSVGLGLGVWDRGAVSARGLTIARCWDGAGVFGAGSLTWEGGGVSGARETSMVAEGGAAALTGLTLSGAPRAAVSVTGRARLSLRACRVSGGACGASARGGAFSAVDTRFDAQTEAGLDLEGGPHELSGVRVSGAGTGLIVSGRARAADLGVEAAGAGVLVRPGGALTWEGGWARGGEVGLCLQGGRAHVSGVAVAGAARQGLRLEGGRFTGIGLEIGGCGETGLLVEGDARARLADCLVLGGRAGAAVSSGRMRLEACRFEGQSEAGLELAGRGHVLERVRAAGAPRGLVLRGEARARDLVLEASGVGLEFHAGADLSWLGGAVRGGEIGVLGVGGRARLEGVSVSGARLEGLRLEGGRLEGRGLRLEGDGQTALLLASGEARLTACAVRGWGRGVAALRGRAVLGGCRFEGQRQAALELAGPQCHELRGVEVSGAQTGLVLTGRARVRGLAVSALATGVEVRPGGALLWQDGGATGGDRGLVVSGGRTTLSGVSLRGSRLQGLRAEGGEVTGRGLVLEGHGESGVLLAGGARLSLYKGSIRDCSTGLVAVGGESFLRGVAIADCALRGVVCRRGWHRFERCRISACGRPLVAKAEAEVSWDGGAFADRPRPSAARAARAFVLATRGLPGLRLAYKGIYALGVRLVASWARGEARVAHASVGRGWVSGDWEPGISDLDFVVLVRDLGGAGGGAWLRAFWSRYRAWKRWLPFLGEVLVAAPEDARAYADWGGPRAAELSARSELLAGEPIPAPARPGGESAGHMERCHAYTRLMHCLHAGRGEPPAVLSRQAFKAGVDLLRQGDPAGRELPRLEYWRRLPERGLGDWKERLAPLALGRELPPGGLEELACAALRWWDARLETDPARGVKAGPAAEAAAGPAAPESDAARVERAERGEFARQARQAWQDRLAGLVLDDLYRSYVILPDAAAAEPRALARWLRLWSHEGTWALPVILTPRLWSAWAGGSYLEDPFLGLELSGPGPERLLEAGLGTRSHFRYARWEPGAGPAAGPRPGAALQAAANLRLTWRLFGAGLPGVGGAYVRHYLLTRVLGLRLALERGREGGLYDLTELAAAWSRDFGPGLPDLAAGPAESGAEEFFSLEPFVSAELARLAPHGGAWYNPDR